MNKEGLFQLIDTIIYNEKFKGSVNNEERFQDLSSLLYGEESQLMNMAKSVLNFESNEPEEIEEVSLFYDKLREIELLLEDYSSKQFFKTYFEENKEHADHRIEISEMSPVYVSPKIMDFALGREPEDRKRKKKKKKNDTTIIPIVEQEPIHYASDDALFEEVTLIEYTGSLNDFKLGKKRRPNSKNKTGRV